MSRDDAYDTIARFLSNCLNSDDDRAEYLSLLDELYSAPPAPAAQPSAEPPRDIDALAERLIEESDGRWHDGEFRIDSRDLMTMLRRALDKQPQGEWQPVPPRACIKPTHEAANAFWLYWRENGETHKHGFYESTWGAINAALAHGWNPPALAAAPQDDPVRVLTDEERSGLNNALCNLAGRWVIDGDWMTCKGCKRSLIASRVNESLAHAVGCKLAATTETHPWRALLTILRPLYAAPPAPAAQPSAEPTTECTTCGATVVRVTGVYDYPPPGEELVRAAREMVERYEARQHGLRDLHPDDREAFDEAIDALRRALDAGDGMGGWIACADRMPTPGVTVLAYYRNEVGNGRRIRAQWVPAKTREGDGEIHDLDLVYDEDADTCYWPEGWYEQMDNWAEYTSIVVTEGEVTHWHPMPAIDNAMGDAPEAKGGGR